MRCEGCHGPAVGGVPLVVAARPRQLVLEGGDQIVDGPADDGVVVHAHVDVQEAYRVADTCCTHTLLAFGVGENETSRVGWEQSWAAITCT